jgi:hypothetical protein
MATQDRQSRPAAQASRSPLPQPGLTSRVDLALDVAACNEPDGRFREFRSISVGSSAGGSLLGFSTGHRTGWPSGCRAREGPNQPPSGPYAVSQSALLSGLAMVDPFWMRHHQRLFSYSHRRPRL